MRRWFALAGALAFAGTGAAQEAKKELPPWFGHIPNVKEDSALSMECDGDPLGTINCRFVQVTVSVRPNEGEEMRASIKKASVAERKQLRDNLCAKSQVPRPDETEAPSRRALKERALAGLARACSCHSDECFESALFELAGQRQCNVWTHTFSATLKRVIGERKWVGVSAPYGLCNVVNATVVESDEKGLMWKFTQTRLTADKSSELCKDLSVNEPATYSSHAESSGLLNCEIIRLSH